MWGVSDATWTLSGFGDEIDPDPGVQAAVLQALGAGCIEVRSAWRTNIVDLDDDGLDRLAAILAERGMSVSAIASPIGKVDVSLPADHELRRLERAIAAAGRLGARYIRVFSFYRAPGVPAADVRDAVLHRMRALASAAEAAGVVLLHENEKEIYGDTPERCLDIVESVGSPALRLAWDSANFVQVGVARPFDDGYRMLRPHLEYLQVKDALSATGEVTPAGEGDGQLLETLTALRDDGYRGYASLEPHLTDVDALGGFSGPAAFGVAARALRRLTDRIGVTLA
ncbi:MAG: sugar phosphate isomerase/epimerase family protein [Leifsonia sp.]|uniref:sugar phosphate isomerase/epimerase family protein n=1 Tax=Leifsonia sp. TaxID=1870902 RepID=UPI003F80F9A9